MKKSFFLLCLVLTASSIIANEIIISFIPKFASDPIDSIIATNFTKGQTVKLNQGESLLISSSTYSDMIFTDATREGFLYPNPSEGYATISFQIIKNEKVSVAIYNAVGEMVHEKSQDLTQGIQKFQIGFPAPGLYHVVVHTQQRSFSYKTVSTGNNQPGSKIQYMGVSEFLSDKEQVKSAHNSKLLAYSEGDILHYTAFSGEKITVIPDSPKISKTIEVEFHGFKDSDQRSYKVVKIGTQWWMAENLAYLPAVNPASAGSTSSAYYYVYNFNGTDISAAKATESYKTYGVLYNWFAAKTACPESWHLATDAEWKQLGNYLSDNGYNYDGTTGGEGNKISKSLAARTLWNSHTSPGVIGNDLSVNNRSGFSALPGGCRLSTGGFYSIKNDGFWWTQTASTTTKAWNRNLKNSSPSLMWGEQDYGFGFSVRCVKD